MIDIIPFLTLIASCVTIINGFFSRLCTIIKAKENTISTIEK
jgi:hypothetical protein